eukprot:gene36175-47039_t
MADITRVEQTDLPLPPEWFQFPATKITCSVPIGRTIATKDYEPASVKIFGRTIEVAQDFGYKAKFSICGSPIKNVHLKHLQQWVLYHKFIGVDDIFIFDRDNQFQSLATHGVHVISHPLPKEISRVLNKSLESPDAMYSDQVVTAELCYSLVRKTHDWTFSIDTDEFITFTLPLISYHVYPANSSHSMLFDQFKAMEISNSVSQIILDSAVFVDDKNSNSYIIPERFPNRLPHFQLKWAAKMADRSAKTSWYRVHEAYVSGDTLRPFLNIDPNLNYSTPFNLEQQYLFPRKASIRLNHYVVLNKKRDWRGDFLEEAARPFYADYTFLHDIADNELILAIMRRLKI